MTQHVTYMKYSNIGCILSLLLVFGVGAIMISCGHFDWNTVALARGEGYCVSARNMQSGVWNPTVLELWYHSDCSNLEHGKKMVRLVNGGITGQIQTLERKTVVVSTYHDEAGFLKNYFVFNSAFLPDDALELDYRDVSKRSELVTSDSTDAMWFDVVQSDDWREHVLLTMNWQGFTTTPFNRVYFLNVEESKFLLSDDKSLFCRIRWRGSDSTSTIEIHPPEDDHEFLVFRIL